MGRSKGQKVVHTTMAEKILRVQEVEKLIVQGYTRQQINDYSTKKWNIETRTVDDYCAEARANIKNHTTILRDDLHDIAVSRFNDLYQRAYKERNWKECRAIQDSLNAMTGNVAPVKTISEVSQVQIGLPDNGRGDVFKKPEEKK